MTAPRAATVDLRLVPAAATSWAVTAAGIVSGPWAAIAAAATAVVVGGVAAVRWRRHRDRSVASPWPAVLAAAAVGFAFSVAIGLRAHELATHPIVGRYGTIVTVSVTANESPRPIRGGRVMFRGELTGIDGSTGAEAFGRVLVFASALGFGELTPGRPATFRARVGPPTRPELTVAVLSATGEPTLGAAPGWQRAAARVRADTSEAARAVLPADQAAMLPALVLGDTSALTAGTTAEFRAAGLTHLTAVSGANVTIVCGAVLLAVGWAGPRTAALAAAAALVAFVAVVQPSASVLRAAVMGAIALFAIVSRRRRQAVPALSTSVLVLLIAAPELAVDVGFALSVVATGALVLLAPTWSERLVGRGWPKPLADVITVALAAQLVTAPIIAGLTGTVSLVAVVANLLAAVVVAPITVLGTAAAALSTWWPTAAQLFIRFTGPELWWLLRVAQWSAAVPGATMAAPSGWAGVGCVTLATLAAVVLWRWRAGRVVLTVALLCLLAWASGRGCSAVGPA